ncbi:PAAR-like domain-containing protein [Hafnia alvei]|nr:PAAR-like domain-containing protein [Hafnia alvei]
MARQDGSWTVVSLCPDVCKTPMGSATPPIPYSVIAFMGDAVQIVPSVKVNGCPVLVLDQSFIPYTKGDEPGVAKGIKSGTVGDICEPLEFSKTVFAGGKPVLRHFDTFWMNARNTTGLIIGQPPKAAIPASEADPAPKPETKEEQCIWDQMLMVQMEQNRLEIDTAPQQVQMTIGFIKAIWNQFPDTATMLIQGSNLQYGGEMQMNAAILSAMGMDKMGESQNQMGKEVMAHAGDFNLDKYRLEMSNEAQDVGGRMYDYGSLVFAGYGLLKVGFTGLKAMRAVSELAREEAAAGKFTADLLKLDKAGDAAKDTEKLADNVIPEGQDGANVSGEIEGTGESQGVDAQLCTKSGEPVDIGTGDFLQHFSVLSLPGSLPLTLSRFYRSQAKGAGIFGPKWTDEWSASLTSQDNRLHFTDNEGVVLYYRLPQDGIFRGAVNSRQAHYRLTGNLRDGVSVFDRRSQQTQLFSPAGKGVWLLSAVFDNYGNRINFIRTNGLLTEVRHSDGYTLTLAWQQSQLMSIDLVTPQRQRLVSCHYDSNGFLAECDTFQFSHLWHEYTSEGFMTRWRDTDKTCVDNRGWIFTGMAIS